jgi:hypothetical protein
VPNVLQFLIILVGTDPLVWRRIQVPGKYSFWDLHVAIQDAMGWKDYHLHEFKVADREGRVERVGIPDEDGFDDRPRLPGWEVPIANWFGYYGAQPALYNYDFGDDWDHVVAYEGMHSAVSGTKYPRCLAGACACPPEDCGGVSGYAEFLHAIRDRRHPEHRAMLDWIGRPFDPNDFDPSQVSFDDPRKRWKRAFQE